MVKTVDGGLSGRLRSILCGQIWSGEYPDGARLPTERALAQRHGMSRVTVRSTLSAMEGEGLIRRRQGHGTNVTLRKGGWPGTLDIIAVIAPAQNPFFSSFMQGFEAAAEAHGALVVFTQTGPRRLFEILFRFYQRGIRNAVVWPYDERIEGEKLSRIRGLGMNIVFFDRMPDSPAADSVSIDNAHAIRTLYRHLTEAGCASIAYVGWRNAVITSTGERERAFASLAGGAPVHRLRWRREQGVDADVGRLLEGLAGVDGLLCGNGVIGMAVKRACLARRRKTRVACVDDLPGAAELRLTAYSQPMRALAAAAYARLAEQNRMAEAWTARICRIRGRLRARE
jgi:DNA-binding LacI/PurR family transcriptional regulator